MSAPLSLDDLVILLKECAGEDETVDLTGDILDTEFEDLGYDSLALFNTVGRIERDYEVQLPDGVVGEVTTPRALLGLVNEAIGQPA
ncbi:acyl carrier protein [Kutzneria viridogrisea]|uniref:Act minimal PKS acyl carrier protein n=1 Tax=Kutzneria viridogrisea TaxID=47990 RepID=A0ABR6BAR4_9PSEU|nr:act minimal PKS acyl carrier protein [Kutzneria viridogrisea]